MVKIKKFLLKKPSRLAVILFYVFGAFALFTLGSLFLLPIWVTSLAYFLTLILSTTAFVVVVSLLKSAEEPMAAIQSMMGNVDMEEVMALASSLFGKMPTKPTGPIGVVDESSRT